MRSPLNSTRLVTALAGTPVLGVEVHERIGSTNARAAQLGQPWVLVLAELQDAGRGRLGRRWEESPYAGLAMSVLVPAGAQPEWLPLVTGLALRAAVAEVTGLRPDLKWPNDLLDPATGRKLAGILCERTEAGVVIGAGLNVDHTEADLPLPQAISVALALGAGVGEIDREALVTAYLRHLASRHRRLGEGAGVSAIRDEYVAGCATLGREITVEDAAGGWRRAQAIGIDETGRLSVKWADGGTAVLAAGDVHHVRMRD